MYIAARIFADVAQAAEISEIAYAFGPQLKVFMAVGFCLRIFTVSYSSLSEDSAEFRYVPLYIVIAGPAISVQWLELVYEMATFFSFCQSFGGKF